MADKPLKYKRSLEEIPKLDEWRQDFIVGDSAGMFLFPTNQWYGIGELWERQQALQENLEQFSKIGPTELERRLEFMWLIGWLERSHYDL